MFVFEPHEMFRDQSFRAAVLDNYYTFLKTEIPLHEVYYSFSEDKKNSIFESSSQTHLSLLLCCGIISETLSENNWKNPVCMPNAPNSQLIHCWNVRN